ncbi:MAG: hypothetical protein HY216_11040 [Candidatus Rokubacteria bacterium]|nr:hypothetical protein [Candidatus Rokubacteria bacterium]
MGGVNQKRRRSYGAALLMLAWVLTLHEWIPAVLVVAFAIWFFLHKRLEAGGGDTIARRWREAWPPGAIVLVLLLGLSALAFATAGRSRLAMVLPLGLTALALSMLVFGNWWRAGGSPRRF